MSKKKFPKIKYHLDQFPGCCGIGVVSNFYEDTWEWVAYKHTPAKKLFETKEEQAEACYKDFIENTWTRGWDGHQWCTLMASLVSNYKFGEKNKKEQYPEMEAILQREGWTIINVFINPNHGNEVTVYMKTFEDRNKPLDDDDE